MRFAHHTEKGWRTWLHQVARRYTRCADTAEDWVQATLVAFWQRFGCLPWERVCEEADLRSRCGWCRQKLRWLALDAHKCASVRHEQWMAEWVDSGERLAVAELEGEILERLAMEAFVHSLPFYLRRVAVLYNEGYSYKEIAELLGVSVGTVQGYIGRIGALGREFFGVSDNKSGVEFVNHSRCPDKDIPNRLKEVDANATTEGVIGDCDDAFGSQSFGASTHPFGSPDCRGGGG